MNASALHKRLESDRTLAATCAELHPQIAVNMAVILLIALLDTFKNNNSNNIQPTLVTDLYYINNIAQDRIVLGIETCKMSSVHAIRFHCSVRAIRFHCSVHAIRFHCSVHAIRFHYFIVWVSYL